MNGKVIYRLLPDPTGSASSGSEYFQIDPEDGTVVLARSLDRETQSQHHLLVMAADEGTPSLSSTAHIWIQGSTGLQSRDCKCPKVATLDRL